MLGLADCDDGRVEVGVKPSPGSGDRCFAVRWAVVPVAGEPVDVSRPQRRQDEADRQHGGRGQMPSGENGVDERPTHPAVPVREGMNRLELRVHQGRLDQRCVHRSVQVAEQVFHQRRNLCGRRWYVDRIQGVPARPANPVLDVSQAVMSFLDEEGRLELDDIADRNLVDLDQVGRRPSQDRDVVSHQPG
jgi:hypothetical protein